MAMTTAAGENLLQLLLENTTWPAIGDATGLVKSTVDGVFYISAHTSSPGVAGGQATNEISYTGYARPSVVRTTSGWNVSGLSGPNALELTFGAMTAGAGGTITHVGIGTDISGAGNLVIFIAVDTSRVIVNGVEPKIAATALDVTAA